MIRRETLPMSCKRHALHAARRTRAAMNTAYPVSSFALSPMFFTRASFRDLMPAILRDFKWHHVHRRIANFVKKTVYDRAMQQDVPTRSRRLPEDDLRDAFTPREIDQRIRNAKRFEFDYSRSQLPRETDVFLERCVIFRLDPSHLLTRCFDIHGVPIG